MIKHPLTELSTTLKEEEKKKQNKQIPFFIQKCSVITVKTVKLK